MDTYICNDSDIRNCRSIAQFNFTIYTDQPSQKFLGTCVFLAPLIRPKVMVSPSEVTKNRCGRRINLEVLNAPNR